MDARMPTPTVIAFGEALVDRFRDRDVPGGAPFNVACHLAAFGVHPVLLTRIGKDAPGDRLLQAMRVRGLDTRGLSATRRGRPGRSRSAKPATATRSTSCRTRPTTTSMPGWPA